MGAPGRDCAAAPGRACGADVAQDRDNGASLPQSDSPYATRRRFLILAAMAGWVQPERVTERILAELADEVTR